VLKHLGRAIRAAQELLTQRPSPLRMIRRASKAQRNVGGLESPGSGGLGLERDGALIDVNAEAPGREVRPEKGGCV
jgi:hypothetical protein